MKIDKYIEELMEGFSRKQRRFFIGLIVLIAFLASLWVLIPTKIQIEILTKEPPVFEPLYTVVNPKDPVFVKPGSKGKVKTKNLDIEFDSLTVVSDFAKHKDFDTIHLWQMDFGNKRRFDYDIQSNAEHLIRLKYPKGKYCKPFRLVFSADKPFVAGELIKSRNNGGDSVQLIVSGEVASYQQDSLNFLEVSITINYGDERMVLKPKMYSDFREGLNYSFYRFEADIVLSSILYDGLEVKGSLNFEANDQAGNTISTTLSGASLQKAEGFRMGYRSLDEVFIAKPDKVIDSEEIGFVPMEENLKPNRLDLDAKFIGSLRVSLEWSSIKTDELVTTEVFRNGVLIDRVQDSKYQDQIDRNGEETVTYQIKQTVKGQVFTSRLRILLIPKEYTNSSANAIYDKEIDRYFNSDCRVYKWKSLGILSSEPDTIEYWDDHLLVNLEIPDDILQHLKNKAILLIPGQNYVLSSDDWEKKEFELTNLNSIYIGLTGKPTFRVSQDRIFEYDIFLEVGETFEKNALVVKEGCFIVVTSYVYSND